MIARPGGHEGRKDGHEHEGNDELHANDRADPVPYCGAEMKLRKFSAFNESLWGAFFRCKAEECECDSPIKIGETEDEAITNATVAALKHYVPLLKPLTLDELKKMNGEPVWIVEHPDWGHWELSDDAEDYVQDRDEDFYGLYMPKGLTDPEGRYGLHVLGWLAYRSKPTDEERAAEES